MIESTSAIIKSYRDSDGNEAIARIDRALSGMGAMIRLVNMGECGCYWLCRRKDNPNEDYILLLPSARWEQDARDGGYELVQKLNHR